MVFKKLLKRWQGQKKYEGSEKRKCARLIYPPSKRPRFEIKEHKLEVVDISEEGLKLLNPMQIVFGEKVSGTIALLTGESMDLSGKIRWQAEGVLGVLMTPIPESTIIEEIRTLLRTIGSSQSD